MKQQEILIAAISSAPILLAKAGLLKDTQFTGGIWQNFFDYFEFLPRENFKAQAVLQDKKHHYSCGLHIKRCEKSAS